MKKDELCRIASDWFGLDITQDDPIYQFAQAVAAAERSKCAEVCDAIDSAVEAGDLPQEDNELLALVCANAIRRNLRPGAAFMEKQALERAKTSH